MEEEYNDKITALTSDVTVHDKIKEETQKTLRQINEQYEANKDKALAYVFDSIIKINIEIPEVVIGNFESKFEA